jgi:hypothetical protein
MLPSTTKAVASATEDAGEAAKRLQARLARISAVSMMVVRAARSRAALRSAAAVIIALSPVVKDL